ncbi:MAG TPA: hypothetical protein VMF89_23385 [Polyangiales bacterium]|nr:hypothetical protein [Polyangiales bacterium]
MPGRKKIYELPTAVTYHRAESTSLQVQFRDSHGDITLSFDFEKYGANIAMNRALAFGFRHYCTGKSTGTTKSVFTALLIWMEFLATSSASEILLVEVDTAFVRAFLAWLELRGGAKATRVHTWQGLRSVLSCVQRLQPQLTHPDLELPYNAIPRPQSESARTPALSRAEIAAVMRAASNEASAAWSMFQQGQRVLSHVDYEAIRTQRDLARLDFRDLGVLLAVIDKRFDGIVPPFVELVAPGAGLGRIARAVVDHGGISKVTQYLHATPDTLIPFMIAICGHLFANPFALLAMRRDCMTEHVLLEGRVMVTWEKARATRPQRRSFLRGRGLSAPNLIDQVLAMSEPLVRHAAQKHRNRLFLAERVETTRSIAPISPLYLDRLVKRFAARHSFTRDSGEPLKLMLGQLRATGLTLAHEALAGDITKTQILANHADPRTTVRYVSDPRVRAAHAAAIGRLQTQFVESVRSGALTHIAGTGDLHFANATEATASGFSCRDPLAGIAPGQKKGRLCTAWLGCFTCPNAVVPLNLETLARLLVARDELLAARQRLAAERWALLYAPKLDILERDIIARFPEHMMKAAETLRSTLPQTPPIE